MLHGVRCISRYEGDVSEAEKVVRTTKKKKKKECVSNESVVLVSIELWK